MGLFKKHIPSFTPLEKKVKQRSLNYENAHEKAEHVLRGLEELEHIMLKNLGEKGAEALIKNELRKDFEFLNSRISLNHFDEVNACIKKIKDKIQSIVLSKNQLYFQHA